MTPLEELLSARPTPEYRYDTLHRWSARLFPPLAQLIDRRIWPSTLRHMRWIIPGFRFVPPGDPGGAWEMRHPGREITRTRPLAEIADLLGRPVSIIATGPSVLKADWSRLREGGRFVIAVNGATTVLKDHGVRADLHLVIDRQFAESGLAHLTAASDVPLVTTCRAASIIESLLPGHFSERPLALVERVNAWYGIPRIENSLLRDLSARSGAPFQFPELEDKKCSIGWSDAPQLGIFTGFTVTFSALQIAVYLGAKDIEIIGMDLSDGGRAYAEGAQAQPTGLVSSYEKYILPSFEMMHRAMAGRDVKIRNLSPVCPLPAALFTPATSP